jgi:hypothetical protein
MGLTNREIAIIVNRYVGVEGGYLGDFSYRTHAEFYTEYCDLDVDPYEYEGTTRERFIAILSSQPPRNQAKIVRGVIERFGGDDATTPARQQLRADLETWARRLEGAPVVGVETPIHTRAVVVRALDDAEDLMRAGGPTSAVDRIHTALHGHLLALCEAAGVTLPSDPTSTQALKALRQSHPALQPTGPRADDLTKLLNSMASVLDTLNPIRNRASVAHPNAALLDEPEALLAINAGRTVFDYIDRKLSANERPTES